VHYHAHNTRSQRTITLTTHAVSALSRPQHMQSVHYHAHNTRSQHTIITAATQAVKRLDVT
jgi:hypothetical protein